MNASTPRDEIETALRAELRARTATLTADDVPFARIQAASRRDRIRRRTLLGTALVLVAALAAAPSAVGSLGGGSGQTAGDGGTPLYSLPARGNLVGDTAFVQAVTNRYFAHSHLLYANDDGTHTVVIGVGDGPAPTPPPGIPDARQVTVLVGPHGAQAGKLAVGSQSTGPVNESYTFVGEFDGTGGLVPYVVLGPTNLTKVEYATGVQLRDEGGKLTPVRTGVTSAAVTDGTAAGEIQDTTDLDAAFRVNMLQAWQGSTSNGTVLNLSPGSRTSRTTPEDEPTGPAYNAFLEAVVQEAHQHGITVDELGSNGQELTNNASQVMYDLVVLANVNPSSVTYSVDWVGRETAQWDSALIEFDVPGLPKIQAFIRGLAIGQPESDYPGLRLSFVRPAVPLTPGHLPTTAAEFGGTPEFTTVGGWLQMHW